MSGGKGAQFHGRRITAGSKRHSNVISTILKTEHLLPKDLRFEHGAPNVFIAPGSIKPCYAHRRSKGGSKEPCPPKIFRKYSHFVL